MEQSEISTIESLSRELQTYALTTTQVIKHLHQHHFLSFEEKLELLRTENRSQRTKRILNILKKKQNGFQGLIESLMKEKTANAHLVQKLRAKCKKFQTQKPVKKELLPSTSQTEIKHLYERMLKLIKGRFTEQKTDPSFEEFDKVLDDIEQIRKMVTRTDHDDYLEMDILVKRIRTENRDLKRKDENTRAIVDRLEKYLYNKEEKIDKLEAEIEAIRLSKEEEIKARVDVEVKRRLLTLPVHTPSVPSEGSGEEETNLKEIEDDDLQCEDSVSTPRNVTEQSFYLYPDKQDTRRSSIVETTPVAWGTQNACYYIINPTNVNIKTG